MKQLLLLISILILTSCGKTTPISYHWKHCRNSTIGDFLSFKDSNWTIKNDTIYFERKAIAIVEDVYTDLSDKRMELTIIKSGKESCYCSKGLVK